MAVSVVATAHGPGGVGITRRRSSKLPVQPLLRTASLRGTILVYVGLLQRVPEPLSAGFVWIVDNFGWWWNLFGGALIVVAGLVILLLGGRHDDAYACITLGTGGILVGMVLLKGRQRRRRRL